MKSKTTSAVAIVAVCLAAQFLYDTNSATFKPSGEDSSFGAKVCYKCHTAAKATDYIFTGYPVR
jgi:hypothetical protein